MKIGKIVLAVVLAMGSLAVQAQAKPDQVVFGYSATWYDGQCPPENYNYGGLTHLARSFLNPRMDGSLSVPDNFFNEGMENLARRSGVKLIMSLGGEAPDANNWLAISRNEAVFKRFCDGVEKLLQDHSYDGIDIDWEPSALTNEDGAAYTSFLKRLRVRFPKIIITTCMGAGEYWISHFPNWEDIYNNVDYINMMTYCYSGGWGERAAYASNLFPPGAYAPEPAFSVAEGMDNVVKNHKVPAGKLLMGITFWGTQFNTKHIGDTFPKGEAGQGGGLDYTSVMRLKLTGKYKESWDAKAAMPYLEKIGGSHVVTFENPKSIQLKADYAKKTGFSGVIVWHVGADSWGSHAPLMDSLATASGASPQTFPRSIVEKSVADTNKKLLERKDYLDNMNKLIANAGGKAEPSPKTGTFSPTLLSRMTDAQVEKKRLEKEKLVGIVEEKIAKAQSFFKSMPVKKGKALDSTKPLLVDDFEKGKIESLLGGAWAVDNDHNGLGTKIQNETKFIVPGGANGSKFSARIQGHYGKSVAPWPYAVLVGDLDPAMGPVDLSGFKAVEFWVKGDGKKYEAVLDNPKVLDYANFRSEFTAPAQWTKVTLALSSFHQPNWGAGVDRDMGAVKRVTFQPSGMNDEDFDISIDDLTFVPQEKQ